MKAKSANTQIIVERYIDSVGTGADVAREIGVTRQLIYLWRTGRQQPSISTLIRILIEHPGDSPAHQFALDALRERHPALADILDHPALIEILERRQGEGIRKFPIDKSSNL